MRDPTLTEAMAIVNAPLGLGLYLEENEGRWCCVISCDHGGSQEVVRSENLGEGEPLEEDVALQEVGAWLDVVVRLGHHYSSNPLGKLHLPDVNLIMNGLAASGEVLTAVWDPAERLEALAEAVVSQPRDLIVRLGMTPQSVEDRVGWLFSLEREPADTGSILYAGVLPVLDCPNRADALAWVYEALRCWVGSVWLGTLAGGFPARLPYPLVRDYHRYARLSLGGERRELLCKLVESCPDLPGFMTLDDAYQVAAALARSSPVYTAQLL